MPQLDISTFIPQLFWFFISFGLLYFLLSKICLPKLVKIFDERDLQISQNLKAARLAKDEALKLKLEYELILTQAAKTKENMIAKSSKELTELMESKLSSLDQELKALANDSEKRMQLFEKEAQSEIVKISEAAILEILNKLGSTDIDKNLIMKNLEKTKSEGSYVI